MSAQSHSRSVGPHANVADVGSSAAPQRLLNQVPDVPRPRRLRVRCETDRIDYARNAIQPDYDCFGLLALAVLIHYALKSDDASMHDGPDVESTFAPMPPGMTALMR